MTTLAKHVELVPVHNLHVHPRNPRRGKVDKIEESISANGFYGAVLAQKSTSYIIVGNHRYKAAVKSGASEVPVIYLDVDDETALRILLADNRLSDLSSNDPQGLLDLLKDLSTDGGNLNGTGYSPQDMARLLARCSVPDTMPEYDESAADDVAMLTCPHCAFEFPKGKYA